MVLAWYFNENSGEVDHRAPHKSNEPVSVQQLIKLGVLYWRIEDGAESPRLLKIRSDRAYKNHDFVQISPQMVNAEQKLKTFYDEHLHDDEEIRFVLDGSGYFDVRDNQDRWIRILVEKYDLIVLPAGIFHRFSLDLNNFAYVMRLFQDEPKWVAHSRQEKATEERDARSKFLLTKVNVFYYLHFMQGESIASNGRAIIYDDGAPALAHYPHIRIVNGVVYISGLSSRRQDGSHVGAVKDAEGNWILSIEEQTKGCIENMNDLLRSIGLDLTALVDFSVFLTDMKHFKGYNSVYNAYFDAHLGPTRTTVAVKELPHPNILIEIKAIAALPKELH